MERLGHGGVALLLIMVSLSVGCDSDSPSQPTSVATTLVVGRIVDAIDFNPVGGARLTTTYNAPAVTASDGSFSLQLREGTSEVTIEALGYWTRTTRLTSSGAERVEIDILPDGKGFNLAFFDYVFRRRGACNVNGLPTVRPRLDISIRAEESWFRCLQSCKGPVVPWMLTGYTGESSINAHLAAAAPTSIPTISSSTGRGKH
jgi:Carboxypeptidase regulatory-like domain